MPEPSSAEPSKIAELKRRLGKEPGSRLFLELAREYHEAGRLEEAAAVCTQGIARHPGYLSAHVLLGRVYFDLGRTAESRAELESVLARAPENLMARRVLAEITLREGDAAGALERFRALLAFSPSDPEVREAIDRLEAEMGGAGAGAPPPFDPEGEQPEPAGSRIAIPSGGAGPPPPAEARADREEARPAAARPDPTGDDLAVLATPTLAEIFLEQGMTDKAVEIYRRILEGDPGNEEARARIGQLGAGAEPAVGGPTPRRDDRAAELSRRTIDVLSSWLEAIRRGARVP